MDVFIEKIFKFAKFQVDSEIIIDFLSNICSLLNEGQTYSVVNFDFILREIFLYFIAYGLKYKNYSFVADLLYSPYYFEEYNPQITNYFVNLDRRGKIRTNDILGISLKSDNGNSFKIPLGELLVRRSSNLRELLVDADLLCCYVSCMNKDKFDNKIWFPYTYIYKYNDRFDYFTKLTSKKYFNKIKELFDVNSVEEFKDKVTSTYGTLLTRRSIKLDNAWGKCVEPIEYYINLNLVCSER